jgi:hypothetical protein
LIQTGAVHDQGAGATSALPARSVIVPAMLYFMWHSLHDRVQGNWPSFLYPALAIAAAAYTGTGRSNWALRLSRRLAVPVAAMMVVAIYVQGLFGVIPIVRDPVSRLLAVGIDRVAMDIETLRTEAHAQRPVLA